jgi:hypothetical protein
MDGAAARSRNQPGPAGNSATANERGEDGLTRREHDILSFERQWWKYAGAKEEAIKELFDMSGSHARQKTAPVACKPAKSPCCASARLRRHLS